VKRIGLTLLAIVATVPLASPAPAAGAAERPRPIKIVQIGDSYSAGNGADDYYGPRGCYRSRSNWAELYVRWLRGRGYAVTFINRACSGAVIDDLTRTREMDPELVSVPVTPLTRPDDPGLIADLRKRCVTSPDEETARISGVAITSALAVATCRRRLAPQVDAIGKDTDLVLFTAGGNDVNFEKIVEQCFAVPKRDPGSCRKHVDQARRQLPDVKTRLVNLLATLRDKRLRPDAKVALLAYPYLSSRSSWTLRSIRAIARFGGDSYDAGKEVRAVGDEGDATQRDAVAQANRAAGGRFVTYVDTVKGHFAGREPDPRARDRNPRRWIHEFDTLTKAEWYHPNSRGHEEEKNLLTAHEAFDAASPSPSGAGSVDLVFVIDATGSMQPTLDQVKALTTQMVDLLAARTSSYRFALVTYRDHPSWTGEPGDYPGRVDLAFTTDTGRIRAALGAMVADGGGDSAESVYTGLDTGLGLPWRPGVKKVVIQIGDAPPHDPEPVSDLTAADVIRHALAVDPAEVYPIDVSGRDALGARMAEIAAGTGGRVTDATAADVGTVLLDTITGALRKPYAWAGGPYVAKVGQRVELDASGSFDPDGTITTYEWDLDGDGSYDTTTPGPVLSYAWDGEITGVLGVRVTDDGGGKTVATARLAVTRDGDEVPDRDDNCPADANPGQEDDDGDGRGDVCDPTPLLPAAGKPGVFEADDPSPVAKSTISGLVFLDANRDGHPDRPERGLANVTVELTGKDAGGVRVTRTATTDASGRWSFGKLLPGTYQIRERQPAGFADGADRLGRIQHGAKGASAGRLGQDQVTRIILSGIGSGAVGYSFAEHATATSSSARPVHPAPTRFIGHGLPRTGAQLAAALAAGGMLVGMGAVLVRVARRRRRGTA
jgi:lysophospholipase L1-like esterase/Mg-chelatase subunit ChlD